jgi:hypothetical protein
MVYYVLKSVKRGGEYNGWDEDLVNVGGETCEVGTGNNLPRTES